MESRMYLWEETYENIYDSCPRPDHRKRARRPARAKVEAGGEGGGEGGTARPHPRCICAAGGASGWRARLREVVGVLEVAATEQRAAPPQHLLRTVKDHLETGLCCCNKRCDHKAINMPVEEFEQNIWDLYTFFLNGINIVTDALHVTEVRNSKESETQTTECNHIPPPQTTSHVATEEPEHRTEDTTISPTTLTTSTTTMTTTTNSNSETTTVVQVTTNEITSDLNLPSESAKTEPHEKCNQTPDSSDTNSETESLKENSMHDGDRESVEVREVVFQNSIFELLQECVAYKDVHRYILLTELRTLFMLFTQSLYPSCYDEDDGAPVNGDWLDR